MRVAADVPFVQRSTLLLVAGAALFALPVPGTFVAGFAVMVVGLVAKLR